MQIFAFSFKKSFLPNVFKQLKGKPTLWLDGKSVVLLPLIGQAPPPIIPINRSIFPVGLQLFSPKVKFEFVKENSRLEIKISNRVFEIGCWGPLYWDF